MIRHSALRNKIFKYAREYLRFDDCRFTDPFVNEYLDGYRAWLDEGHHGEMDYLQKHLPFKENPERLLPGVRSAIVVIKNYKNTTRRRLTGDLKISRYAVGQDYHAVMKERLEKLAGFIQNENPGVRCYSGVDSRPLAERSLALKAGIGFRGKNTMVIKPGLGSYFFIGVVLTTHSFSSDEILNWNCGQCRLCLDACPTGALNEPYSLDANRCISYMTIEQKTALAENDLQKTKGWLFGCDICQEACPYNHEGTPLTDWKEFRPEAGVGFEFFRQVPGEAKIPQDTPIYRSRKRVVPNWKKAYVGHSVIASGAPAPPP